MKEPYKRGVDVTETRLLKTLKPSLGAVKSLEGRFGTTAAVRSRIDAVVKGIVKGHSMDAETIRVTYYPDLPAVLATSICIEICRQLRDSVKDCTLISTVKVEKTPHGNFQQKRTKIFSRGPGKGKQKK